MSDKLKQKAVPIYAVTQGANTAPTYYRNRRKTIGNKFGAGVLATLALGVAAKPVVDYLKTVNNPPKYEIPAADGPYAIANVDQTYAFTTSDGKKYSFYINSPGAVADAAAKTMNLDVQHQDALKAMIIEQHAIDLGVDASDPSAKVFKPGDQIRLPEEFTAAGFDEVVPEGTSVNGQ